MTLKELRDQLEAAVARPTACNAPVQVMRIKDGVTYAVDIAQVFVAEPYDGERVWIVLGAEHAPAWMGGKAVNIVYRSVLEEVLEAVTRAEEKCRTIARIELESWEGDQLYCELATNGMKLTDVQLHDPNRDCSKPVGVLYGVPIVVQESPRAKAERLK